VRAKAVEEAQEERTAQRDAVRECKAQHAHPLGRCVSQHARQNEAEADQQDQEDATAQKNAAKECAAERDTLGAQVFGTTYGTENANYKNAFGKCVSKKTRENDTEE
jgi:hypothetical protein